jgi:hypothetical protein
VIDEGAIRHRWETVGSKLDERGRRLFAAAEVQAAGYGGLAVVSRITGLARSTIIAVRTTSAGRRWRRGRCGARAADARP